MCQYEEDLYNSLNKYDTKSYMEKISIQRQANEFYSTKV